MKVLTFLNEKGGVGKSTLTFNVAYHLASTGKKVLLVDLDPQISDITFIAGIVRDTNTKSVVELEKGNCRITDLVLTTDNDNLNIIPGTTELTNINKSTPLFLRKHLNILRDYYDYCFIDVSPTPNRLHAIALEASDYVIIPLLPDPAGIQSLNGVLQSINLIRESANKEIKTLGVVFNRCGIKTRLSRYVSEYVCSIKSVKSFKTNIREYVVYQEAVLKSLGVTKYAPKSKATDDIISLTAEILEGTDS